eukprot:TRINITY_DN6259_c0_g1_i1.p1 TRINITY_DN6259_c0_g1~~TRINITY_DN6259_c0_g1_i1.p1  ORF type:complete len:232 (-),score=71.41 TRINITY_DN6259_c0_g1_i1:219-914(-)
MNEDALSAAFSLSLILNEQLKQASSLTTSERHLHSPSSTVATDSSMEVLEIVTTLSMSWKAQCDMLTQLVKEKQQTQQRLKTLEAITRERDLLRAQLSNTKDTLLSIKGRLDKAEQQAINAERQITNLNNTNNALQRYKTENITQAEEIQRLNAKLAKQKEMIRKLKDSDTTHRHTSSFSSSLLCSSSSSSSSASLPSNSDTVSFAPNSALASLIEQEVEKLEKFTTKRLS